MRRKSFNALLVLAISLTVLAFFISGPRQLYNMKQAEKHIRLIQPLIQADPRFVNVHLEPFTGSNGSLGVFGGVDTDDAEQDLRKIIDNSHPPVRVVYGLVFRTVTNPKP